MEKKIQQWADAATQNCVWVLQKRWIPFPEEDCEDVPDESCWQTEAVFLTRLEAFEAAARRSYNYGVVDKDWRIYGIPAKGLLVDKLAESGVTQEWIDEQVKVFRSELVQWKKECPKVFGTSF